MIAPVHSRRRMEVSMAVAITRTDLAARARRDAAAKTADAKVARRMLAVAPVIDGVARRTAAESCGMDRQTLRGEEDEETVRGTVSPTNGDRNNDNGLEGLSDPGSRSCCAAMGITARPRCAAEGCCNEHPGQCVEIRHQRQDGGPGLGQDARPAAPKRAGSVRGERRDRVATSCCNAPRELIAIRLLQILMIFVGFDLGNRKGGSMRMQRNNRLASVTLLAALLATTAASARDMAPADLVAAVQDGGHVL